MVFHEIQATIVSSLTTEGVLHSRCAYDENAVFDSAIREKLIMYHDLAASRRCAFLVLAAGTGCR